MDGARIVAVADAIVDEYVGPFADDGVNTEVRIASGGGVHVGFDGDADRVIGATVVTVVGFISIAVAIAAAVAEGGDDGVDDFGGID